MKQHHESILKALVALAWSDGHLSDEEGEVIEAMIDTFEVGPAQAAMLREYAKQPRTLDEIPLDTLSEDDRHTLLTQAVILSYIDGEQDDEERDTLADLVERLGIDEDEADGLMEDAEREAHELLDID